MFLDDDCMTSSESDLLALLRELDDPVHLEWPQGYDRRACAEPFRRLVARLEQDFAVRCELEQDTQDSSEYGRIHVPAAVLKGGSRLVVCLSKFGNLALICADNPGAFLSTAEAIEEGELHADDLVKVDQALRELGYVVVPEELLTRDYEGPSKQSLDGERPDWWARFFGYF